MDGDDFDATPQHLFYSVLAWCDQLGIHDQAERMRATGPPPPEERDGYYGKVAFYEHNASANPEYARLLEQLKAAGPPDDPQSSGWTSARAHEEQRRNGTTEGEPR